MKKKSTNKLIGVRKHLRVHLIERIEKWDDKKWGEGGKKKWEDRRYFDLLLLCLVRGWKSEEMEIVLFGQEEK